MEQKFLSRAERNLTSGYFYLRTIDARFDFPLSIYPDKLTDTKKKKALHRYNNAFLVSPLFTSSARAPVYCCESSSASSN